MTLTDQLAAALRDALEELNSRHPVPHDGMIAMANALAAYEARPAASDDVERVARAIQSAEASSLKIEGFYYANHPGGPHVIRDFRTDPRGVTIWVGEEREAYSRELERLKLDHISRAAIAAMSPAFLVESGALGEPLKVTPVAAMGQDQELEALRELSAKATKGPWDYVDSVVWIATHDSHGEPIQQKVADTGDEADAAFIAAAANYVRAKLTPPASKG